MGPVSHSRVWASILSLIRVALRFLQIGSAKDDVPSLGDNTLPVAKAEPLKRFGIMKGRIVAPDDFDTMGRDEIHQQFDLKS